jgi:septal ring-binding cell division protein DamX
MLVFNDASSKNNQQFIEHFAEQEHCNLFNAATEVSSLVNHIKQALKTRGTYYLDCVGTLMASNDKTYFQPDVATVFCEDMYGLEVLTMEPLATRNSSLPKVHRPAPPVHGEQVTEESKRNWTIHLNKRKVGYTLGAVATLLVILCLSLPLTEKYHIGFASLHNIFYSTAVDSFNEKSGRNSDTVINSPVKQEPVVAVTKKVNKPMAPEVDVQPKGIISEEELIEKHKDLVDNGKLPSSETNTSAKEAEKAAAEKAAAEKAAAEKAAAEKAAAEAAAKAKAEAEARAKAEAAKKEAAALAAKEAAAKEAAALAAKEAAAKEAAAKEAAAAKAQGSYTIVLASAVSEKNADDYVERLKKNGFKDAKKYKKGTMVRVIYSSFASETEARNQLKKLRSNEAFEQAWVYEMK